MVPTRAEGRMAAVLAAVGRQQRYSAGELLHQQGDSSNGFWLIESGTVMVCRFGRGGDLTVYAVLGPGDLFGELACFAEVPRQVDAVVETDAVLVRIDASTSERLLAEEPGFARWLLRSLANQLRTALDRIEGDRNLSAQARLARALADLAARDELKVAITQQELADFVGVSRVTTGQALAAMADQGLIVRGYRQITVLDRVKLRALAQDPT